MSDLAARMHSYFETYNSADAERISAYYAPGVKLFASGGEIDGRVALLGVYREIINGFTDLMTPKRILTDDAVAMVEIEDMLTAKHDVKDFLGKPVKAGETVTLRLAGVYEFEDGLISRITMYAL